MMDGASSKSVVRTVTGVISVNELGFTLPHEHLLNNVALGGLSASLEHPDLFHSKVAPDLAWILNEFPYSCYDNCVLDRHEDAAEELSAYVAQGGRTVVEVTPEGQGRDLEGLAALSRETGVNIVAGGGWYLEGYHPDWAWNANEQAIADYFLDSSYPSLEVDREAPLPGVIGEIGVSPGFTFAELKMLRAACLVQRERNLPLYVHLPGFVRYGSMILDIVLKEQGVPPQAVILCHMDPSGVDPQYQLRLAERGVWLEFDMIGMPYRFTLPGEGRAPSVGQTLTAIRRLVEAGFADSLLFSHDMFLKGMLRKNGGNGLTYIPGVFNHLLEREDIPGFDPLAVNTDNVSRMFSLATER